MIHLQFTLAEAQDLLNNDPALRDRLKKAVAFEALLPWPEPPRLAIYRDGELIVEYYDQDLCQRLEHAMERVLREPVKVYKEISIEWP